MKIVKAYAQNIHHTSNMVRDGEGHSHPGKSVHDAKTPIFTIECDDGTKGYAIGGRMNTKVLNKTVAPAIIGEDPFDHEKIWQRMTTWQRLWPDFNDHTLGALDIALWDVCGKKCNLPVYKLLGGVRDKVPCYASTMVGDDIEGGLNTPKAFADFALKLVAKGYRAIKLHTWMSPIVPVPNPKLDVECCRMVREAVGPDIDLMLDTYHYYTRTDAYYIAREIEKLGFLWLEEPMDENSMESYAWLQRKTTLPICGPETAFGKERNRANWIVNGACDIGRAGVDDVGGITAVMKTVHLYSAFGMSCEIHGARPGNLQCLGAMSAEQGKYFERGLEHPLKDLERPNPWENSKYDQMDRDGMVQIPQRAGMGWDLNFDYIENNIVE